VALGLFMIALDLVLNLIVRV